MNHPYHSDFNRRKFLQFAGLGALGTSILSSLIARAQAGAPKRLLLAARPHGSIAAEFFPQGGSATSFQLPSITSPFEPVKSEMVMLTNLSNPRRESWAGEHDAGLFGMTIGREGVATGIGNGAVGTGISVDQWLAQSSPALGGTLKHSIQLAASPESAPGGALNPGLRILSYSGGGTTGAMDPETRPDVALSNLFANVAPSTGGAPGNDAAQARARQLNRAVLDQLVQDASRLKAKVPVSQQPKLDEQLSALADLTRQNDAVATSTAGCATPTLAPLPGGAAAHAAQSRAMFQIMKGAFLCDITRVASFSFAPEQSSMPFNDIIPNEVKNPDGHHDISHAGDTGERGAIDKFYCSLFAELLLDMKNTADGPGTSLLDNTVVAFITAIDDGNGHGTDNMPVALFGGKSLGLAQGRIVDAGGRTMNDVWTAVAQAFGVAGNFGDPALVTGPLSGLFT